MNESVDIDISPNDEYQKALPQWQLVEDCVAGQNQVKSETTKYLPIPDPETNKQEGVNSARYQQYLLRAVFYNVCFRTLQGLVGAVFRKPPTVEIPESLGYIEDNADGSGLTLNQQAQWTMGETIKKGRALLLVDYPVVDGSTSRADVARGIRATIKNYPAECVLDWNEEVTSTGMRLNYVKIVETRSEIDIATGIREEVTEYVVLRLIDGVYSVHRYTSEAISSSDAIEPTLGDGSKLDFIPAVFVGSENNNPDVDQALLYDLAVLNIAHYRNSADYE